MDALAVDILIIFKREGLNGWEFLFRWMHVLVGIIWIGLLYYFNFVQVPAFAEFEAGVRNSAIDKLASRALWWFRWAAVATLAFGILILAVQEEGTGGGSRLTDGDYWKTAPGIAISTGILLAVTMFANVWLVIWPQQKKVIANARNVLAGGQADPDAAAAGRKAALASRQNTIFSFPMLFFMVGTAHFFSGQFDVDSGGSRGLYWAITLVLWLVFELNCLGIIGGTSPQGTNWIYEDHKRAIGTGLVLTVIWYLLWVLIF